MKRLFFVMVCLFLSLPVLGCRSMFHEMMEEAKEKSEFRQTYDLSPTGSLSLSNVNGSVTIKVWDDPRVEVKAIKKGPSQEKLEQVKIDISSKPDNLKIDTVYPVGIRNANVSVAYEITVPRTIRLDKIETVNGAVEISGVQGKIETETTNGSITIDGCRGGINAETVNGGIKATLPELPAGEQVKMETVNGSLTVYLPENLNAEIDAETTNGRINNDFNIPSLEKKEKHLRGTVGSGGSQLKLETTNGSISIASIGKAQAH